MVEKDPGTSEEMMTLSIVHGHPMRVGLGDAVGAPWVEGSAFVLGYLNGLSEHLAAAGLVEAGARAFCSDAFEQPRDSQRRELGGGDRLLPRGGDERLCRQIIDLVRLRLSQDGNQRRLIEEVAW